MFYPYLFIIAKLWVENLNGEKDKQYIFIQNTKKEKKNTKKEGMSEQATVKYYLQPALPAT